MDKITKLSDAIRLGATFRPQAQAIMFDANGGSCALGAAYEAITGIGGFEANGNAGEIYGTLRKRFCIKPQVDMEIARRNDGGESREAIADWLQAQGL